MISIQTLTTSRALVRIDDRARLVDIGDMPDIGSTYWDGLGSPPDEFKKIIERFEQTKAKPRIDPPGPRRLMAGQENDDELKKARRRVLRKIAAEVTAARDRGFAETDKYIPSKGLELGRQVDVVLLYLLRELKDEDEIWMRNWWTGHQEKIKVGQWLQGMREGFRLRQALRQHEQDRREEIEGIFNDTSKSAEERIAALDAYQVEPNLDLPEDATVSAVEEKLQKRKERR